MRTPKVPTPTTLNPLNNVKFWLNLPRLLVLTWRLFTDKRVWLLPKLILVVGLVYLLCPFDLLPFLPQISWMDDTAVMGLALWLFMKLSPRNVVQEHVEIINQGG